MSKKLVFGQLIAIILGLSLEMNWHWCLNNNLQNDEYWLNILSPETIEEYWNFNIDHEKEKDKHDLYIETYQKN
jgi:hypothetical protein